jgi:hypothetical protein
LYKCKITKNKAFWHQNIDVLNAACTTAACVGTHQSKISLLSTSALKAEGVAIEITGESEEKKATSRLVTCKPAAKYKFVLL